MMIRTIIAIVTLYSLCPAPVGQTVFGGGYRGPARQDTTAPTGHRSPSEVFRDVEEGITTGEVASITEHFGSTVRLDVRGNQAGYYSANQAGQILRHFFSRKTSQKFKFSREENTENPYATGAGVFTSGGRGERIQIYVGLVKADSLWVISQFNIY